MNEIKLNERKIAKRVAASFVMDLVVARERQSMDFPSEEALKKYLKDHPSADPSKHSVKKSEGGKKPSGDSGAKSTLPPKSYHRGTRQQMLDYANVKLDRAKERNESKSTIDAWKTHINEIKDGLWDSGKKEAPKADKPAKPHKKKNVNPKAVKKVQNVLRAHNLNTDSDEVKELAHFKSTLGQRVPEKDIGKWYARNVQTLKADFLKNMNPSNYKDAEAFKAAKDRMSKMPPGDFAKILAAMTDDEE